MKRITMITIAMSERQLSATRYVTASATTIRTIGATIWTGSPAAAVNVNTASEARTIAIGTTGRSPPVPSITSIVLGRLLLGLRQPCNRPHAGAQVLEEEREPHDGDEHGHEYDERH